MGITNMGNCCGRRLQHFDPDQKYRKIRSSCRWSGNLFEDDKFPASSVSLSGNKDQSFSYLGQRWKCSEIKWLRPHEICENLEGLEPRMIVGERDRFDINQGEIGDCWFLAPLATLAENQYYFEKVVPKGQNFDKSYYGVFRFRFYRFGEWHEIVIDDKLTTRNGKLIYLRAKEANEFWSPLLEKAYAKFYGSYAAIEGGVSMDAAVDFTGGIPQMIDMEKCLDKHGSEYLFHLLKISDQNGAFVTCSLGKKQGHEAQYKGLQSAHAYSITKVKSIKDPNSKQRIPLLRLRNPHGNANEWNGDWSDGSDQWTAISKRVKRKLGLEFESDGEFYMSYNRDFLKYFGEIEIVNLNPIRMELNEDKMTRKFNLFEIYGRWQRGINAGGTKNFDKNSQHNFTISNKRDNSEECSVVITLTQKLERRKCEHSIGFRLYDRKDQAEGILPARFINNALNVTAKSGAYINAREVSKTLSLPAGSYSLVPSTFEVSKEAKYMIRIYVDNKWNCQTEGERFTIRDHECCFTCCYSCRRACCSCCRDDDYYKEARDDQTDVGQMELVEIERNENWCNCSASEIKVLGNISNSME